MKDFIPFSRQTLADIVAAELDETVAAVRERLRTPDGDILYNAPILVRLPDGRIAPTAAPMLRKLAEEKGATILKDRLKDLIDRLCPEPWSVESQEPDYHEAANAASRKRLPVIVTEKGRRVGLMLPPGHRSIELGFSKQVFDLFDDPFPRSLLDQTEIVVATLNTTVAKVALDLKTKREPEKAYIVVEMDDGSFGVMSSRDLNHAVERFDAAAWSRPLRTFGSHLRTAEAREVEAVGRKQAQTLADARRSFLILTDQGKPVGLLLSQDVLRTASLPQARPPATSLFDAPQQVLQGFPFEVELEKGPRFVNLWFKDRDQRPVDRTQALILGRTYYLALNVGHLLPTLSIVAWERTPGGPQPIVEPQEKEAFLYVSVFSQDFDIPEPTKAFRLPKEGDTDTVHIQVEPLRRNYGSDPAKLEVCLYYRTYLVQTFEVRVEVVAAGESARTSQPQVADLIHARTASFPEMETLLPRELSLTITRDGPDGYRFTFLVDPDPADEAAASRAIELACRVRLTREDLTHLITKARRQLYNIARARAYQEGVAGDALTGGRAMRTLALLGRQLYSRLFESGGSDSPARAIADWIKENLPENSTIQIVDLAHDFVFPWSLVYDEVPWDRDGLARQVALGGFWGYRYKIEFLTEDLIRTYRTKGVEVDAAAGLRIGVGLNDQIPRSREQRNFFEALSAESGERAEYSFFDSSPAFTEFLEKGNRDIFYVFCHGFTERMAADIQLGDDLIGEFKTWLGTLPDDQRRALKDHEGALFNVSDSWIKLTYGEVPLTMMEYYAAPQLDHAPLVFLNMCESAQVLPSLSGGFIPFFLQRGARSIIGTECPMTSTFADAFAREFFRRLLQGQAVGQILRDLRRDSMEKGNPLGLAYTLYGDADTKVNVAVLGDESIERRDKMVDKALEQQINRLWLKPEDDLYTTLGINLQAIETATKNNDVQKLELAQHYEAVFTATDTEMGALDDLKAFGKRWWAELEPRLYDLLCNKGNPEHETFMTALGEGAKMLAVALVPALVAQAAVLPAVAIVIATIAAKKIYDSGLEAACSMWKESLDRQAGTGQG